MGREEGIVSTAEIKILEFIKDCIKSGYVFWTYHVNMRLKGRFIPREKVLSSVDTFEIIESYPVDKYFPSYLIRFENENQVFHVVFAVDKKGDNVRIITVYKPSSDEWDNEFRRRIK